ncbi:MAG: VWA domain-containing protein [Planctomycetota bacterium]
MSLAIPELLFLLIPFGVLWWRYWRQPLGSGVLRAVMIVLATVALAGPIQRGTGEGIDLILILDRTASMPGGGDRDQKDSVRRLEETLGPQDRLAIVSFGERARIESPLTSGAGPRVIREPFGGEGATLDEALSLALTLVDDERPSRMLVLSDGRRPGESIELPIHEALRRDVVIDALHQPRGAGRDLAVERLDPPLRIGTGRPFSFGVQVFADRATQGVPYRLSRDGQIIARGELDLPVGRTRLAFRDVLDQGGIASYTFELLQTEDSDSANNRARALVQALEPPRALVLTGPATGDAIAESLERSGWQVDVDEPSPGEWTASRLHRYGAIVLQNISIDRLSTESARAIAAAVRAHGAGLLVGGGGEAYQAGGWVESPLEEVLPVSLRPRRQERRVRTAIVVVLDRSGSMAMPAGGGLTKMDLANRAGVAVLELLQPSDQFGAVVVDSAPHVVVPLVSVGDKATLASELERTAPGGGGIFVGVGLQTAYEMLQKADATARHILLFADAEDSEEPGDYRKYLPEWRQEGITVSVVGLGTDSHVDAPLLDEIAHLGGGRIDFTMKAEELPRLFARDTIETMMRSYIVEPRNVRTSTADLLQIGELSAEPPPAVGAHHRTTALEGASVGWGTEEEDSVPLLAFWSFGRGRVVAMTFPLDGPDTGSIASWPGLGDTVRASVDWSAARLVDDVPVWTESTDSGYALEIELDDPSAAAPELVAATPQGAEERVTLEAVGPGRFRAEIAVDTREPRLTSLLLPDGRVARGPGLVRAYSSEHRPDDRPGESRTFLEGLAGRTGGLLRLGVNDAWNAEGLSTRVLSLRPFFAWLLLIGLLLEVFESRTGGLSLGLSLAVRAAARAGTRLTKIRLPEREKPAASRPQSAAPRTEEPITDDEAPPPPPEPKPTPTLGDALRRARKK